MKHFAVRGIVVGIPMIIVGIAYMALTSTLFPSVAAEYQNTSLFYPMSDWHMQSMPLYYIVLSIVLSWAWDKLRDAHLSPSDFALGYWFIASVPGMLITWMSFQVSILMILTWLVSGLIDALIAAYSFRMIDKRQMLS